MSAGLGDGAGGAASGATRAVAATAASGSPSAYVGRFAPSPTGLLHAGSVAMALASWLDARAHGGRWLVRIEDVDTPRCKPEWAHGQLAQLAALGLVSDGPVWWQSQRADAYAAALASLQARGLAYPCVCTRQQIEAAQPQPRARHQAAIYPGTCRPVAGQDLPNKPVRAWRLRTDALPGTDTRVSTSTAIGSTGEVLITWSDRRLGRQQQSVTREVGDFVLHRADGPTAYQLAVVVDDAAQGITDVVRGEDLVDNTARQIHLQRALALPTPRYWHGPLVRAGDGEKLSKQNGAEPIDTSRPLAALQAAGAALELPVIEAAAPHEWLTGAVRVWRNIQQGKAA